MTEALAEVRDVTKHFPLTRSLLATVRRKSKDVIHAVERVSLAVGPGETVGLIGESGSGKTTLGWLFARLHEPTSGAVRFGGRDISHLEGSALRGIRRRVQIVFQDPVGSLDPRLRVWQIVGEPLQALEQVSRSEVRDRVAALLPTVGLPAGSLDQYPHEFSGGGRQRLSLARALSVKPQLVILDEPTSALDVAVQAQILNRLVALQRGLGLSYLLAVPAPEPGRRKTRYRVTGEIPSLVHPPPGCPFAARCPFVIDRCLTEEPLLRIPEGMERRWVACHRAEELVDVRPADLLAAEPVSGSDSLAGST